MHDPNSFRPLHFPPDKHLDGLNDKGWGEMSIHVWSVRIILFFTNPDPFPNRLRPSASLKPRIMLHGRVDRQLLQDFF